MLFLKKLVSCDTYKVGYKRKCSEKVMLKKIADQNEKINKLESTLQLTGFKLTESHVQLKNYGSFDLHMEKCFISFQKIAKSVIENKTMECSTQFNVKNWKLFSWRARLSSSVCYTVKFFELLNRVYRNQDVGRISAIREFPRTSEFSNEVFGRAIERCRLVG